jgi:hypothetical protein
MWSFYTEGNKEVRIEMARQAKINQYRVPVRKHSTRAKKSGRRASGATVRLRKKV